MTTVSPFAEFEEKAWPYRHRVTLKLDSIAGGIPSDPAIAEAWIASKVQGKTDDQIKRMAAETMAARGITEQQAIEEINKLKHLNGFKRDGNGLFIEGRQIKAMIKEGASIAAAAGKLPLQQWGYTGKYINSFAAEHLHVVEDTVYLGKDEPDEYVQSFPENKRIGQRGIQITEVCHDVEISFTVLADFPFTTEQMAMVFLTSAENGLGACRSQGYGRFSHDIGWEQLGRDPDKDAEGIATKKAANSATRRAGTKAAKKDTAAPAEE